MIPFACHFDTSDPRAAIILSEFQEVLGQCQAPLRIPPCSRIESNPQIPLGFLRRFQSTIFVNEY